MDHLTFNHGRMVFSYETLEMTPSLPDEIELRIQIHQLAESGLIPRTFIDFDELQKLAEEGAPLWIHLSGSLSDDFWKSLKKFSDLSDQQIKDVRHPHKRGFVDEHREGIFWTLTRPFVGENLDALETINFFLCERLLITRQFSHDDAFKLAVHKLMSKGEELAAW